MFPKQLYLQTPPRPIQRFRYRLPRQCDGLVRALLQELVSIHTKEFSYLEDLLGLRWGAFLFGRRRGELHQASDEILHAPRDLDGLIYF